MAISPLAGKPAPKDMLIDVARLERAYFESRPELDDPSQLVSFGTSGHRGSSLRGSFTESHILAITQAICEYRRGQGIDGPLYLGKDTHALSGPAQRSALEVLAVMKRTGRPLAELVAGMPKFPQVMINVRVKERVDPAKSPAIQDAVRRAEKVLGSTGRVVLRASGTEPVIRVMIEAEDEAVASRHATELAELVRTAI